MANGVLTPEQNTAIEEIKKLSHEERERQIKEYNPALFGINHSIEADLQRFRAVGDDWAKLDEETYKQVLHYFAFHASMIRVHHHAQSEHFAPKMNALFPEFADEINRIIVDEHKAIEERLQVIEKAIASGDKAALPKLFEEYQAFFLKHLDVEEEGILIMKIRFDREKLLKVENEVLGELAKDKHDYRMNLGWFFAGMDDEARKAFFKQLPPPVPILWKLFFKRQYEKKLRVFKKFA